MSLFTQIQSKPPISTENGVPYYGSQEQGDQFDKSDVESWTTGGRFARRWQNRGKKNNVMVNDVFLDLCKTAASLSKLIMEIACGPGMGLLPDIFAFNPNGNALATDACPALVENWSRYMAQNAPDVGIEFACFSATDMPIRSNSVDVITSMVGFGSLRYAGADNMDGVREAYRVLKYGGHVFAIESQFEDMKIVEKTFELWGKPNWFENNKLTWKERFKQAGFLVEQEILHSLKTENDFELGTVAQSFGLEIAMVYTAYMLRKV